MAVDVTQTDRQSLVDRYSAVRRATEKLCETLATEDYVVQTVMEVSPAKWHLGHTAWFFETFILKPLARAYHPSPPIYAFLFNSYYNAAGKMHARPQRGQASRPTVQQVCLYREQVDAAMQDLIEHADEGQLEKLASLIELGCHHEQQHQELILTDIKHVFWMNPMRPVFRPRPAWKGSFTEELAWEHFAEGLHWIGHEGEEFHFDNEGPRHRVFLEPFAVGSRLVTNREYLEFMEDNGYRRPELWLSLAWIAINEKGWDAPLYWEKRDGRWWVMTLAGMRELDLDEPVCHVSYFEADAFARWAQARLITEAEWEIAAQQAPIKGNFVEAGFFHPAPLLEASRFDGLNQMFGDVWQWTQSSYSPYPGFESAAGALGEYNGKFMCNQYVLRGASCATPRSHARRTYRNFFPPDARWQFMGIRLGRTTG